ncbi:MAG TPA: VOC family protein [Burkholderiaceae bacterium]|nr:VOC family protein [Burkholderiaceae bacterium]
MIDNACSALGTREKPTMNIAHVALWTKDLDGAAAFWVKFFGATVGDPYHSKRREGFVSRFVTLPGNPVRIELMTGPWIGGDGRIEAAGWDHVALSCGSVEAVDALADRCQADGRLVSPPRRTGDGYYEAVISMPDGTRIEITG